MTQPSPSPRARAAVTYSARSVSSRLERIWRMMPARSDAARTSAGKIKWWAKSQNCCNGDIRSWIGLCAPPTGNQPVDAANHSASSDSKMSEMDNPTNEISEQARSTHESFFTAAQMPNGMATPHAKIIAKNESTKVFHTRAKMSDVAGIL